MKQMNLDKSTAERIYNVVFGLYNHDTEGCVLRSYEDGEWEIEGGGCKAQFEFTRMFGKPCVKSRVAVKRPVGRPVVVKDLFNSFRDDVEALRWLLASAEEFGKMKVSDGRREVL